MTNYKICKISMIIHRLFNLYHVVLPGNTFCWTLIALLQVLALFSDREWTPLMGMDLQSFQWVGMLSPGSWNMFMCLKILGICIPKDCLRTLVTKEVMQTTTGQRYTFDPLWLKTHGCEEAPEPIWHYAKSIFDNPPGPWQAIVEDALLLGFMSYSRKVKASSPTMWYDTRLPLPGSGFGGDIPKEFLSIGSFKSVTMKMPASEQVPFAPTSTYRNL